MNPVNLAAITILYVYQCLYACFYINKIKVKQPNRSNVILLTLVVHIFFLCSFVRKRTFLVSHLSDLLTNVMNLLTKKIGFEQYFNPSSSDLAIVFGHLTHKLSD